MVICLEQGVDLHMAQLMPLVPAHLGSPGKRAVNVCVCVCACACVCVCVCVCVHRIRS